MQPDRRARRASRALLAGALVIASVGTAFPLHAGAASADADAWRAVVSSPTDPGLRLAPRSETTASPTRVVRVDPDTRRQTWTGVGATLTDASVALLRDRPDALALLFDADAPTGARLDLLRLPLSATDFSTEWWTWTWTRRSRRAVPPPPARDAIAVAGDIDAIAAGLRIVATPWTAPSSMKSPRRVTAGALADRRVDDYAELLAGQARHLLDAGLPLAAMTIVNEPGHADDSPTMTMTDDQLVRVGELIGPRLAADGVELWAVDHNWADRDRVDAVTDAAPDIWSAAAFHCYLGTPDQMAGSPVPPVVTECTGTDDTWSNTFAWDARHLVADAVASGSAGLMMWNLALDPDHGPKAPGGCETCRGLVTVDPASGAVDPTPEFYTLAHLARAARPGDVHVATSGPDDVPVAAFAGPDGSIGVFGHNDSGADQVVAIAIGDDLHRFAIPAGAMFSVGEHLGPTSGGSDDGDPHGPHDPVDAVTVGDLAIDPQGGRWYIADGASGPVRQRVLTQQTFVCDLARGGDAVHVPDDVLDAFPIGTDRAGGTCILRAPEGDAHVVNALGFRQWIPDGATWFCEIDRGAEVIATTRIFVDGLPEGPWRECG